MSQQHVDYPHEPGRLSGCPACEAECFCGNLETETACVHCAGNAVSILNSLGARWSPNFDDYASGRIPASEIICVLCNHAPCRCQQCTAPYKNRFSTEPERPCGMTLINGVCPRGHDGR